MKYLNRIQRLEEKTKELESRTNRQTKEISELRKELLCAKQDFKFDRFLRYALTIVIAGLMAIAFIVSQPLPA